MAVPDRSGGSPSPDRAVVDAQELAARSGISRRLIVQMEQAQANPSVGTLLRLADAFEVTLSEFLPEQPTATVGVRPASETLQLWDGPRGGACRLLVSHGPIELWSWTLKPGEVYESKPHRPGSVELLSVTAGILDLDVGRDTISLSAGDSAWFEQPPHTPTATRDARPPASSWCSRP